MFRKTLAAVLICLFLIGAAISVHADFGNPDPALNAVAADLSLVVGTKVTRDQFSHYSYAERLAASGTAECPAAGVLFPTGNERVWTISVSYHGSVYYYFATQDGSKVVRCGSTAATATPTATASMTRPPTLTPGPTFTPSVTPTAMTCTGFLTSRLYPGDQGRALPGNVLNLRDQPNSSASVIRKVYDTVNFTVLAGPICEPSTNRAWWQVNYSGSVGWLVEGEGSDYFVTSLVTREPLPATAAPTQIPPTSTPTIPPQPSATLTVLTCSNALPARLTIGGNGRVTPGDPTNLRKSPTSTGKVVRQMYSSVTFTVIGGPACDELGRRWWQIKYNDSFGWGAEGDASGYFLEPAP